MWGGQHHTCLYKVRILYSVFASFFQNNATKVNYVNRSCQGRLGNKHSRVPKVTKVSNVAKIAVCNTKYLAFT